MASLIKILPDRPEGIASHKYGFFCEKFELERLSFCKTMAEQAWVIEEHCKVKTKEVPGNPEWKFSNQEKGLLFGVGRQQFGHLVNGWQKIIKTRGGREAGRPKVLNEVQMEQVREYVASCNKENKPLSQSVLVDWINEKFNQNLTLLWLQMTLQSPCGLFGDCHSP